MFSVLNYCLNKLYFCHLSDSLLLSSGQTPAIMRTIKFSMLILLIVHQTVSIVARADVVELTGGLESGRFIDGVNLTANKLSTGLAAGWSGDNGAFASLSCFTRENDTSVAIQRGCDGSLGWFKPISGNHAVTFALSRHDYSSSQLNGWQYTDASVSWHIGRSNKLKVRASNSLLGQGFASVTTSYHALRPLSEKWRLKFEAGLTALEGAAPVSQLEYGIVGLEYGRGRWAAELKLMVSGSDYKQFVKLDLDEPEASFSLRYRLY